MRFSEIFSFPLSNHAHTVEPSLILSSSKFPFVSKDEQGRKYKFITNNWEISDQEVALIYKCRWSIETTFKKLKQNFQLTDFYSDTENGIKTQLWCTLIAYLLLLVIQTESESKKALSTIAALIRMHLISHLDLKWVVTEGRSAYPKRSKSRNKSPTTAQLSLF